MCVMCNTHAQREPLARMCKKALARVAISTADITVVFHATFYYNVPSRVELWSRSRGPIIGHRVSISKIAPRTAPEYPQGHAQRENGRAFSSVAKHFCIPVFGMHRSTLFGKGVSCWLPNHIARGIASRIL